MNTQKSNYFIYKYVYFLCKTENAAIEVNRGLLKELEDIGIKRVWFFLFFLTSVKRVWLIRRYTWFNFKLNELTNYIVYVEEDTNSSLP